MHNTISPDHQNKLVEQFAHITDLINSDKLNDAIECLLELHHADLADFLDNANRKTYRAILPAMAEKLNPEMIVCLSNGNKQRAIEVMGVDVSANLINKLDIEDAIEIIEDLEDDLKQSIIARLNEDKKQQILEGFQYPENTAGRIVEKDFILFQEHWTVGQSIDFIRRSNLSSDFYAAIIVDHKLKPVGTILLSTLLKTQRNTKISSIMNCDFKIAETHTDLNELGFIFKQYALTIVPVINKQGKLVGTISIDNMLYIIEGQTESEFMHLGGVHNGNIFDNLCATAKHRFPWLFVNLLTACITSMVIDQFTDIIVKLVTLATIMPIVSSMGGNAGTQVMTVTVRAIASREITKSNTIRIIFKETIVCFINGAILAFIGLVLTYLLFFDINLSIIFALAVTINFTIAGFSGSVIPILLNRLHVDPAAASGVFLTTCTDAVGFFGFLGLAFCFLV